MAHNGDGFDLPWFKTRCLFHGIPTHPNYKTIDTLQWAKRKFYFNSNRMDYIAKFLGFGGKIKTELDLWKRIVMKKDPLALAAMIRYCKRDVDILEKVYQRLAEVMPHKTHQGVLAGGDKWTCPHCGSDKVQARGIAVTTHGTKQHRMQCMKDGRWFQINEAQFKLFQEAKKP